MNPASVWYDYSTNTWGVIDRTLGKVIRKYRKARNLTTEEINEIIREADAKLKEESYEEAFQWTRKKLEQYPNCEPLMLNLAAIFDAQRIVREVPDADTLADRKTERAGKML